MYDRTLHAESLRQFGYDQLYVGNPNIELCFSGNLFKGARVWYYSVAGGTRAVFQSTSQDAELLYKPQFLHMVLPC